MGLALVRCSFSAGTVRLEIKEKVRGNLPWTLPRAKARTSSEEDLRHAQAFHTFSSNDALNFSRWYQVWQVDFFMAILWSGYQEEHLELAMLLQLSMEDGRMEDGRLLVGLVTTPYFPYIHIYIYI